MRSRLTSRPFSARSQLFNPPKMFPGFGFRLKLKQNFGCGAHSISQKKCLCAAAPGIHTPVGSHYKNFNCSCSASFSKPRRIAGTNRTNTIPWHAFAKTFS